MPSGHRHTIASATIALSSAGALFLYSPEAAFWCATGSLSGCLLSPDLDVENTSIYYIRRYAGLPASSLWTLFWWPYRKICRHRGFLSHSPIISTAIRLLYISLLIAPAWYWLKLPLPTLTVQMCWWLFGLLLSDLSHAFLDHVDEKLGGRL